MRLVHASTTALQGAGSALMRRTNKLFDIVDSMNAVLDVPVTCKLRTGIETGKNNAHVILPGLRDRGVALATVSVVLIFEIVCDLRKRVAVDRSVLSSRSREVVLLHKQLGFAQNRLTLVGSARNFADDKILELPLDAVMCE